MKFRREKNPPWVIPLYGSKAWQSDRDREKSCLCHSNGHGCDVGHGSESPEVSIYVSRWKYFFLTLSKCESQEGYALNQIAWWNMFTPDIFVVINFKGIGIITDVIKVSSCCCNDDSISINLVQIALPCSVYCSQLNLGFIAVQCHRAIPCLLCQL